MGGFSPGYLSDGHGAEDVEEDEGAVGEVLPQKVAMGQALDVGDGGEGQFGHDPSVKATHNGTIRRCYKPDRKYQPKGNNSISIQEQNGPSYAAAQKNEHYQHYFH